jgi:hypothetical protein
MAIGQSDFCQNVTKDGCNLRVIHDFALSSSPRLNDLFIRFPTKAMLKSSIESLSDWHPILVMSNKSINKHLYGSATQGSVVPVKSPGWGNDGRGAALQSHLHPAPLLT